MHCQHEDDASLSSTLTVDRIPQKQLQSVLVEDDDDRSVATTVSTSSSSSSASSGKSVRFNLADNAAYDNAQLCKEECADLWCSASDYKHFRAHTMALAREITKAEARNRAPYSYERVLLRTYDVCCSSHTMSPESTSSPLSSDERKHLNRWAEVAPTRLGLEKWAVKPIGRDRSVRRSEIVDAVLDLQDTMKGDDIDELIRCHSERLSRPSKLFARCTAEAQAAVLGRAAFFEA